MAITYLNIGEKSPNFTFKASVNGDVFDFGLMWNTRSNLWMISLGDINGWIYENIPLVAGIDYFNYIGLDRCPKSASLFVVATPDYDTLNTDVKLTVNEI
jgi:hypothetical protein